MHIADHNYSLHVNTLTSQQDQEIMRENNKCIFIIKIEKNYAKYKTSREKSAYTGCLYKNVCSPYNADLTSNDSTMMNKQKRDYKV
jgi:hypothetical protein